MRRFFFLITLLAVSISHGQFASTSFVTLNDGMEKAYLELEEVWSEYHKEAVKNGQKSSWAIWKVDPTGYEDKIEKSRIPNFLIVETYESKEQMDDEAKRYTPEGFKKIQSIIKRRLKGKMSSSKINSILSKKVDKERRVYHHQALASTPFTGGGLKPGDKLVITPMQQLEDDYEKYETEFFQKIFADNVMKGNHRWWGFTKIFNRSENALTFNTHAAWNMPIEGKQLDFPEDFASQKVFELTGKARKSYNPTSYELVMVVD